MVLKPLCHKTGKRTGKPVKPDKTGGSRSLTGWTACWFFSYDGISVSRFFTDITTSHDNSSFTGSQYSRKTTRRWREN